MPGSDIRQIIITASNAIISAIRHVVLLLGRIYRFPLLLL